MVVQFVAFVGAYRAPGDLDPWVAAVLAALLTTWVTFVPCFLFILLGAPYVERLRGNRALSTALTGITAAVVGVIASLAVFFALHTLFGDTEPRHRGAPRLRGPRTASLQWAALAITAPGLRPDLLARLVRPPHPRRLCPGGPRHRDGRHPHLRDPRPRRCVPTALAARRPHPISGS